VGSAQSWSSWIQSQGWRGEAEVHRQQLLEWFGASPAAPLKGSAGATPTLHSSRKLPLASCALKLPRCAQLW
jgi:hypothetical protein